MKRAAPFLAVILLSLASPALSQNVDMSSMTPTLTYPEPTTEPVSQEASDINK